MQDLIDRLKAEHEALGATARALLLRVGRRPVSRMALEDTRGYLEGPLSAHEREEEDQLFPRFGAATDPLEAVLEAHAAIDRGRRQLRDGLHDWDTAGSDPEALAHLAEGLLHDVLEHFAEEERQVFNLGRAGADAAKSAQAGA
jgi:hypothetical protein